MNSGLVHCRLPTNFGAGMDALAALPDVLATAVVAPGAVVLAGEGFGDDGDEGGGGARDSAPANLAAQLSAIAAAATAASEPDSAPLVAHAGARFVVVSVSPSEIHAVSASDPRIALGAAVVGGDTWVVARYRDPRLSKPRVAEALVRAARALSTR